MTEDKIKKDEKIDSSLKDKAIKISGKDYVLVADRVKYFNANYRNGSIVVNLLSEVGMPIIVVKATIIPDVDKPERKFEDYAQEEVGKGFINKTSALENASTSAVGRALALMGIGVIDSIASVDEINKAKTREYNYSKTNNNKSATISNNSTPTYKQNVQYRQVTPAQANPEIPKTSRLCSNCMEEISEAEHLFAVKKYGNPLCRKCQAEEEALRAG